MPCYRNSEIPRLPPTNLLSPAYRQDTIGLHSRGEGNDAVDAYCEE